MDADTTFRCWLEMKLQRHHWPDALALIREEVEHTPELTSSDRDKLLGLLDQFEMAHPSERESIALSMFDVLVRYPNFESEYLDFAKRRITGKSDDRREG